MERYDLDQVVSAELAQQHAGRAHAHVRVGATTHGLYLDIETSTHGHWLLASVFALGVVGAGYALTRRG